MKTLAKAVMALSLVLFGAQAQAQARPDAFGRGQAGDVVQRGFHTHDGFFLRLDAGIGYMEQNAPTGSALGDMKVSGAGGSFGVAVGGAVAENLILAGHLYSRVITSPTVSFSNGGSGSANDSSSSMVGIGPELTYYFMPANVYVSGTVAATQLSVSSNGTSANSDWGVGARLALGKEWWVSDNWGLGLAGLFSWSSNKDQGTGAPTISTWGLGLAFSATYN